MADDAHDGAQPPTAKKRRVQNACDTCRKKKTKCDSAIMPNNICSNCLSSHMPCTHEIPRAPKGLSQKAYIRALEERIRNLEDILRTTELKGAKPDSPSASVSTNSPAISLPCAHQLYSDIHCPRPPRIGSSARSLVSGDDEGDSDGDDLAHLALADDLSNLSFGNAENRFFGKGSGLMFLRQAASVKLEETGKAYSGTAFPRGKQRYQYWNILPWERAFAEAPESPYAYPDPDLLHALVNIYFSRVNLIYPILHRPTFEEDLRNGLHLLDNLFGMTVLMVCAVASRYSDDPRVLYRGDQIGLSSGWTYFTQVSLMRKSMVWKTTIYDLQYYCLAAQYFLGTSCINAAWGAVGSGIRCAIERGTHRRMPQGHIPTVEQELWKRAFWVLVILDRFQSSFVGRPCALQDEDFDLDLPIECDDKYWETGDPKTAFRQPPGRPSTVTAFISQIRLSVILAFTLRTLYSTKKSKIISGLIGDQWEQRVVSDLDSAMNKWRDSLPDHLRWDPTRRASDFAQLSAVLYASFCYVQIHIHRPFLQKKSPLSIPSITICTVTARSFSHMLDQMKEYLIPVMHLISTAFISGIVLGIHIWTGRRAGLATDVKKELVNMQHCMDFLKKWEHRWHVTGRAWDMLNLLEVSQGASLQQQYDIEPSHKRPAPGLQDGPATTNPNILPPDTSQTEPCVGNHIWDLNNRLLAQMGFVQLSWGQQNWADGAQEDDRAREGLGQSQDTGGFTRADLNGHPSVPLSGGIASGDAMSPQREYQPALEQQEGGRLNLGFGEGPDSRRLPLELSPEFQQASRPASLFGVKQSSGMRRSEWPTTPNQHFQQVGSEDMMNAWSDAMNEVNLEWDNFMGGMGVLVPGQ